jgi:hypothetical protein
MGHRVVRPSGAPTITDIWNNYETDLILGEAQLRRMLREYAVHCSRDQPQQDQHRAYKRAA